MSDNNRLKSTRLAASGQISPSGVPAHVVAWHIIGSAVAGSVVLNDGGSTGAALITLDTPASATAMSDGHLPQLGVRFAKDCFATISNATAVTIFWY